MKKGCLSEVIFEVVSNEESHYKRRSFDGKARRISQDDKNTLFGKIHSFFCISIRCIKKFYVKLKLIFFVRKQILIKYVCINLRDFSG